MRLRNFFRIQLALVSLVGAALSSCAVSPEGPATEGATYGALPTNNMSDYYYKKRAGWTYVYQNVQHIYDQSGSLSSTLSGANDTVRTLGADGIAPSGDTLYKIAITYRVKAAFAGRQEMDMYYVANGQSQNGAFRDCDTALPNEIGMQKRPKPVSTDTILAGVIGRVRTLVDDFTGTATDFVWQTDTLWFTSERDSVCIWERFPGQSTLSRSRLITCRNFTNNTNWCYDLINSSTYIKVKDPDMTLTTPAGTFIHTMKSEVYTPEVSDNMPITEYKWWSFNMGLVQETDEWYVTRDGSHRNKQDFTHTLVSCTIQ